METRSESSSNEYTCKEYREEMVLLSLQKQLAEKDLCHTKRQKLLKEIAELEKKIGF